MKQKIIKAVKNVAEECFKQNYEKEIPFLISENDLCCALVENLKKELKGTEYRITTEYCLGKRLRQDIIIFNKNKQKYDPNLYLNIIKPEAVIELKLYWRSSITNTIKRIEGDINYLCSKINKSKLKELKDNPNFKYVVCFDYYTKNRKGTKYIQKKDIKLKKGVELIYVDMLNKTINWRK